jgi:hypothetical protein
VFCTVCVLLGANFLLPLSDEADDFLYLADIVHRTTKNESSKTDQVKALTGWLSLNVKRVDQYPSGFDSRSVASVIRGGVGNCGYQAESIMYPSCFLGLKNFRRYWVGPESGSSYWHAFAEIYVDGKWGVFDPDMLVYIEKPDGSVMGLAEIIQNTDTVKHSAFRKIAEEINRSPDVLKGFKINMDSDLPSQLNLRYMT